jgi:hypothetical protein
MRYPTLPYHSREKIGYCKNDHATVAVCHNTDRATAASCQQQFIYKLNVDRHIEQYGDLNEIPGELT